jgi:tetratricopeptide (TPR) repeat protein
MRIRFAPLSLLSVVCLLLAPNARADYGSPPPPPQPTSANPAAAESPAAEAMANARHDAEQYYKDGYDDVVKAGQEAAKGKKSSADKRYQRALERCQKAVTLDSTYHEAWNLVGFTSRKLGNYPQSFAAYQVALRLKPDFALAHEYYGEGLLETGDLAGAKQQLEALRGLPVPIASAGPTDPRELAAELSGAIAKYEAAHPSAAAATPTASTAPADSASTPASAVADTSKTAGSPGK